MATVRPATATGRRRVVSITLATRRLGAGTRRGKRSARRRATSGRAKLGTGRASPATGRLAMATRIGMGRRVATGLVMDTGLTLVIGRRTTATSLDTVQGLLPAGKPHHLAMAPGTGRTVTAVEVLTRLDTDLTVTVTAVTGPDLCLGPVLGLVNTVRRPVTGATVVGIRRQLTVTGHRPADTTTGLRLSTEVTAIRGGQVTTRAGLTTRSGQVMVEVGRVGLGLGLDPMAGCRRAGRIGGGLATRGLPGPISGPATR